MMTMGEVFLFIGGILLAVIVLGLAGFGALLLISSVNKARNTVKKERPDK